MTNLKISQIAREWQISRTTIYKKLENGELSQNEDKTIYIGEVIRVFGEVQKSKKQPEQKIENNIEHLLTTVELEKERTLNEQLKIQITEQKERIKYLETNINQLLATVQELSQVRFLLEQPKQEEKTKKKKFLGIF